MLPNSTWQAIYQYEPTDMVNIRCEFEENERNLEVGFSWSFSDVKEEILV